MCCSECLAKSGMAVSQGNGEVPTELHGAAIEDGRSTAAPHVPFLRDIMAPMSYLEGGCVEATPWTPSIISRSPLGVTLNASDPGMPTYNLPFFIVP